MKSKQGKQNKMLDKKVKKSKASFPSERNADLEEDLSTSEEEMEVAKPAKKNSGSTIKSDKKKQILKEKVMQAEGSDDDDDDEQNMESEDDSEDGEDEDDDDDDDGDDDESEDDDDDEEEENEEDAKPGQKRKAKQPVKHESKKAKLETSKTSGVKSLFFRMMSKDVESTTIEKFFDTHGVKVDQVRRIGGRNFAYVDVSESQLEAALGLSGKKMAGKQVLILLAKDKSEENAPKTKNDVESKNRTLFVKNLGFNVKDADIEAHFPLARNISTPRKPDGKLKGYGYLEFESEEVAEKVMTELQNSILCGRAVSLDYVGDKRKNTPAQQQPDENCKTLCVKQLNYKTTVEQLKAFFKKAKEARIVKDTKTDESKGFGFVVFESHEHAEKALENMQGKALNGRNIVISYALKKKSRPGKTKQESKKKTKKTSSKGPKNVKGSKPTKNSTPDKLKKASKNKPKKVVDGE